MLIKGIRWATADNERIRKSHNLLMNNLQTDKRAKFVLNLD